MLSVPWDRPYAHLPTQHLGLVTDLFEDGWQTVIHCPRSRGVVLEEPLHCFAHQGAFGIGGYPGRLPPIEVLARARGELGRPYDVARFNCEHFVTFAHGIDPESPQLRRLSAGGLLVVGAAALGGYLLLREGSKG